MTILKTTERLNLCLAEKRDIDEIIALENAKENRDYVWQGSYEEHLNEIEDRSSLLLSFRKKEDNKMAGYLLGTIDEKSRVFELRRIVISEKGIGFGRESILGIMDYAFNELNTNRFWLDVYPDNKAGINLYKGLGMIHEGTHRQSYKSERGYLDQMIFSLLRGEYIERYSS